MNKFKIVLLLLVSCISSYHCSKKSSGQAASDILAIAFSPTLPILKGLPANSVIRIDITVPVGNEEQHFRKLRCTLNAGAAEKIQKIDLYTSSTAPFSTVNLLATFNPTSTSFDIPVDLNLSAGQIRYLWFSVVIKNDAEINDKIELRCTKLINDQNQEISVMDGANVYTKRMGTAVRKAGEDAVNTYRIPGIVQTDKGTLIAVYDNRYVNSADLPGNIDVGMSRSTDKGKTWEPMKVIMDMGAPHANNGIGDPAILFDPATKKIICSSSVEQRQPFHCRIATGYFTRYNRTVCIGKQR